MKKTFSFTDENIDFGRTNKEKEISYLKVIDLDNEVIRIPYISDLENNTVEELIANYLKITSYRSKFQSKPCLRLLQGNNRDIVQQSKPLFSFKLNYNLVCFRVQDRDHPKQQLSDITKQLSGENKQDQELNKVKIIFQGKSFLLTIKRNEKVQKVREELMRTVDELKTIKKSDFEIQVNGAFLLDKAIFPNTTEQNLEARVVIRRKQGSFRIDSKVLLANDKYISLGQLKVGDVVKTVNRINRQIIDSIVTAIESVRLQQCVVIKLKNGDQIYTVASNMFYCQSGVFLKGKSQNTQEVCLVQKEYLRLINFKTVEIVSIKTEKLKNEQFLSVWTNNNYNLVINGTISHYFCIRVNFAKQNTIFIVDASPFDSILMIKQKLQVICQINVVHQKLKYAGIELKDEQRLSDKNIENETLIELQKYVVQNYVNLLDPQSVVMTKEKEADVLSKLNDISQIKGKQDLIVSYFDLKRGCICEQGIEAKMKKVLLNDQIIFTFGKDKLVVGLQTYLQLQNGFAISACDYYKKYGKLESNQWPRLRSLKDYIKVDKISLTKLKTNFRKILTEAPNMIACGVIIVNKVINILLRKSGLVVQKICLSVDNKTAVEEIKVRIAKLKNIPENFQNIYHCGVKLFNFQILEEKKINRSTVLILDICEKQHQSCIYEEQPNLEPEDVKTISFFSQEGFQLKFQFKYNEISSFSLKQILKQKQEYDDPAYFCICDKVLIMFNQKINKIQTSELFQNNQISLLILKSAKLSFVYTINQHSQRIKNYSSILSQDKQLNDMPQKSEIIVYRSSQLTLQMQNLSKKLKQRLKSNELSLDKDFFHKPFLYFTSRQYHEQIYKYVRNFDDNKEEINRKDSVFAIIKDLYSNMNILPNYLGQCYYGMRNFKMSAFFKSEQLFYWYNFTLAYIKKQNIIEQLKGNSGTLFYISSTNGKIISKFSLFPQKDQILFGPFSYFLIEKIQEGLDYDQVWLTEVASPVTFKKNIILWVDDNPRNNIFNINQFLFQRPDIQILQLVSTNAAVKWIRQFGWILRWKGLKFKLISDMNRTEWVSGQKVQNGSAGLDLLQFMYKDNGYSARTLIFCGNEERAKKLAKDRKIPQERYIITEQKEVLEQYIAEVQQ